MSRHGPERALRRAVAGLVRLHPDDVEAILGALDAAERARVDALVAGFAGRAPAAEPPQAAPEWAHESVAPWLLARLDPEDRRGGKAAREFVLVTEASREALRAAAEPFRRQVGPAGPRGGTPLLDQVLRLFRGGRA